MLSTDNLYHKNETHPEFDQRPNSLGLYLQNHPTNQPPAQTTTQQTTQPASQPKTKTNQTTNEPTNNPTNHLKTKPTNQAGIISQRVTEGLEQRFAAYCVTQDCMSYPFQPKLHPKSGLWWGQLLSPHLQLSPKPSLSLSCSTLALL